MKRLLRAIACGALVGLAAGFVVGGTLGRAFMRVLFLAREDTRGIETAMGAIIGDFTSGGTLFIAFFGGLMGVLLGLAYVCTRGLMPNRLRSRELLFVGGTTALMLGFLTRINLEDFKVVPVTLSLVFIAGSVALTAAPVPVLVERFAPDRERHPGSVATAAGCAGLVAAVVFAATGVVLAYSQ